jgi:energy-coupling factor transporter ATP-binding protein EcfA2
MLKSITFHPVAETGQLDLTLRDLAMVNILVGANGAGKSRVLRAIELASHEKSNGKCNSVTTEPLNILVGTQIMLQTANKPLDIKSQEKYFHQAMSELSTGELTEHFITIQKPSPLGTELRVIEEKVRELRFHEIPIVRGDNAIETKNFFSGGTVRLANLIEEIETLLIIVHSVATSDPPSFVVLIDELETALHPSAHKIALSKIVQLAKSNFFAGQNSGGGTTLARNQIVMGASLTSPVKIQVFISTHSPFVVAAAAEYDPSEVKVYLLKDGKTRSVKDEPGGEHGYGGMESLFAANWMLGASQRDYIPSKIILAEESIQQFIKAAAKTLGYSLSSYQASTSGDSKTQHAAQKLLELAESHLEFGKMQPWKSVLSLDVIVLLDGKPPEHEDEQWEGLKKKYPNAISVEVISEDEFEELHEPQQTAEFLDNKGYTPWSSGKFKDYAKALPQIAELKPRDQAREIGKLKCELATFVAERIDLETLEQCYSKLFPFIVGREPSIGGHSS